MTTRRLTPGSASRAISASRRVSARQSISASGAKASSASQCASRSARWQCRCWTLTMSAGSSSPRCTTSTSSPAATSSSTVARPMNRVPPRTTTLRSRRPSRFGLGRLFRLRLCLRRVEVRVLLDDQVDQAPLLRLLGRHEEVTLHRALDVFELALAVLGVDARDLLALAEDLLGVDLDVGGLALDALREGLVDED